MGKSQALYLKAKKLIPGGTQLLSKRPEIFLPDLWPAYYQKAKGCRVWDLDGKEYIDASTMGVGSCILGYADDEVNGKVISAVKKANMTTLNAPEEVELAELLVKVHPWAQMARFTRSGGEAMAVAVRIARAHTKKDIVLFCGYHGWHDWYLSANLADKRRLDGHLLPGLNPLGVPRALRGTSFPFTYNDTESFLRLIKKYGKATGAVVMESIRNFYPKKEFFSVIQKACRKLKIVLICDEITAGFRMNIGGAHLILGLKPNIAVFAKGISNGYPMGVILGDSQTMNSAQDSFISSTYWTDRIGPVAAIATLNKINANDVPGYLVSVGKKIKDGWRSCAARYGLKIEIEGIDPLLHFSFEYDNPELLKTLFTQLMLEKGFLASTSFYASYAHREQHIKSYLEAVNISFRSLSSMLDTGKPERYLKTVVCEAGFRRIT